MTNEEAIEYNKNLREYMRITDKNSEYKFLKENYEALDLAIKSLEQQSSEDCVSKEKQIQKLSKMPPMVLSTAYLYAINYTLYGEDVTEKWITAAQNASALEKAYRKGYYDALQEQAESEGED